MIRLTKLTLTSVRNIQHGTISFNTLPDCGSITGIYGQNGSGKTSVIDAIQILKQLLSGNPLPIDTAEVIDETRQPMRLEALFQVNGAHLLYIGEIRAENGQPILTHEELNMGASAGKLGRPIISWNASDDRTLDLSPKYLWDSICDDGESKTMLRFANRDALTDTRSFLFSDTFTTELPDAMLQSKRKLTAKARKTLDSLPANLFDTMRSLQEYAQHNMAVLTTRRTSIVSQSYMPLTTDNRNGGYDNWLYDLLGDSVAVSQPVAKDLQQMIRTFDIILPAMIPGLTLQLDELEKTVLDDGSIGIRVALYSIRDGRRIPFRRESEGVQRIISMLTYLIHAYNDPDACIAIDELDTGIFEYLLGELIKEFTHAEGQLIFTAHNLRVFETVPKASKTITLTTIDPENRFTPLQHVAKTENGRRQYLGEVENGGGLYRKPEITLGEAFRSIGDIEARRQVAAKEYTHHFNNVREMDSYFDSL